MFALDQTIDPIRGFFWPLYFPKQKTTASFSFDRVSVAKDKVQTTVRAEAQPGFQWISAPILNLLIQVVVDAVMFSLLAGLSLGVLYLSKQFGLAMPFMKGLASVALLGDLALLTLSVTRIVIKTLRDI